MAFIVIAAIMALGFASEFIFRKTKIPDVLWLLIFGIIIGPGAARAGVNIANADFLLPIAPYFSALAIVIILFDGGINMNAYRLLKEVPSASLLGVVGFAFASLLAAAPAYMFLHLSVLESLLLGCILGGTTSDIVVSIVSKMGSLKEKLSTMLKIESILTDPMNLIIPFVLLEALNQGGTLNPSAAAGVIAANFSTAIVMGLVAGVMWSLYVKKVSGLRYSYTLTLAALFFLYSISQYLGGNGLIACFVFGLAIGNAKDIAKALHIERDVTTIDEETKIFNSTISFFVRSFFFVFLGSIVRMSTLSPLLIGLAISLLLLVSRYAAVELTMGRNGFSKEEKLFATYMLPRGLSAAVMAPLPAIQYGLPGLAVFTDIVFAVILFTIIITTWGTFKYGSGSGKVEKKPREQKPQTKSALAPSV